MLLILEHPEVATRDCEMCRKYEYDEKGRIRITKRSPHPKGWIERVGKPACRTHLGCPKGTPEEPRTLTRANMMAYTHYKMCKATNQFPNPPDPIVSRNAMVIAQAEEIAEKKASMAQIAQLAMMGKSNPPNTVTRQLPVVD